MTHSLPMIIAHRGASADAPENTLESVALAWEQEADAVEVDVQFSKDKRAVVIHDENTSRVGRSAARVAARTVSELKKLDVGSHKGKQWRGCRIPLLEEVLSAVPEEKKIFIEIKSGLESVQAIVEDVEACRLSSDQICFIAFDNGVLKAVKSALPEYMSFLLFDLRTRFTGTMKIIELVEKYGFDGADLSAGPMVTRRMIDKLHGRDLQVYVWTVNRAAQANRLWRAGVDGITTNKPFWLRSKLQGLAG